MERCAMTLPDRERWNQLTPWLDELLELTPEAQRRRLAELRAHDASLADELEALLNTARRAEASQFLSGAAQDDPTSPRAGLMGRQLGAYVIEAPLGEGSTGSVWRARRTDGRFEGVVAIKLLHLSLMGQRSALRFEREGGILARLAHPNIARLLDAGVTADGQPYLVLELVQGSRIDRHCDVRRLDVEQRLRLFRDVLAAVAHAHSQLVIHRDIKPSNILVTDEGVVKLLDFGIAKLLEDEDSASESSDITRTGGRAMTPDYAAPEQVRGEPVATATDVYALGVLLFELLSGGHPTSPQNASPADVMRATLETEPARLSGAVGQPGRRRSGDADASAIAAERRTALPRLVRRLGGDLENIVAQALRKEPAQRYQTVAALADDLRRHLAHEPVSARPDSIGYRSAKFVRRHRGTVAAGSVVLLAIVAGLAGTITQARRAEVQAQRAAHERDNALRQLGYAKSTNEFMTFLLQEGADKPFTTAELLARAEPVLDAQFAGDPAQRAHVLSELGGLLVSAQNPKKAEAVLLRARAAAQGTTDTTVQVGIECLLGLLQGMNEKFEPAAKTFDAAFALLRANADTDSSVLSACLKLRGDVATIRGDPEAALVDLQAALGAVGTPRPEDRSAAIETRNSLAMTLGHLGRPAAGATEFRRAIAELDALGRGRTQGAGAMYRNLSLLLYRAGQTMDALAMAQRALDIARGLGGAGPNIEVDLAVDLIALGRPREAMPLVEHALAQAQALGDKRRIATVQIQGARAWCDAGEVDRCAEMAAAGQTALVATLPPSHSTLGIAEMALARVDLARADAASARVRLQHAIAIFEAAPDRNHIGYRALTLLARAELQLEDFDAAQAHAAQAVEQARATLGGFPHSEWLGTALIAQGLVQRARGDAGGARSSWSAALVELQAAVGDAAPATVEARRLLSGA
jgi:serine/threonine protein kinase/tetratricopeptide (TPR) repeat protein